MIRAQMLKRAGWLIGLCLILASDLQAQPKVLGEGSDLEIGGPGKGQGKFFQVSDIAFDDGNRLYVLDGVRWEKNALNGNGLVQKFDSQGKFLSEFSILDNGLKDKNAPTRLAIDSKGNVYITQPRAGLVQQYSPEGKRLRSFALPAAHAIAIRKVQGREQILVLPCEYKNNKPIEVRQVEIIDAQDFTRSKLPLGRAISHVQNMKADPAGHLYVQANLNQIYKFAPDGKLLAVLGGGTMFRTSDGSELLPALALDSRGNLFANTYGNPSRISRFNADFTTVTQREGQFAWADAWGETSLLAVDRNDRLWVATPGSTPGNERYHYRPCVLRVQADFLDPSKPTVSTHSTQLLGLHLAVENKLPYGIQHEAAPATFEFIVKASNRRMKHLDVNWVVHDLYRNEVAKGRFALPLQDGVEARQAVSFTPTKFGWYTVSFEASQNGTPLMAVGRHLGVTPKFTGMPVLAQGESAGGWNDPARQAFTGLPLYRIHTNQGLDKIEREVELATKYNLTLLVQFENKKACSPEHVREAITRFKGRVKYWEIMNEPNFFMSPQEYVTMIKELYPLIKSIDPQAKVLGPTVCGIQLPWHEAFYKLGAKDFIDILSIHDYEGNEAIDPGHWTWKIGELRMLMARYGDEKKPLWQTERAIGGVRAGNFIGGVQAVRVLLHRDLLETLGIPAEHNLHYYLNQSGYGTVPTYLWSDAGPHPGALATRTRQAMIQGRRFTGTLDFGTTGYKIFMGLRYEGADGQTITLRNLGTLPQKLELQVKEGDAVEVVDAFGNREKVPAGLVTLQVSSMPIYLRLAKGQTVTVPRIDFGRNYASQASIKFSAETSSDSALLTNGIFETTHPGNPHLGPWSGKLPTLPQTLEMHFPYPRTVNRILLFSMRADNPYCALLDYDLQYHDGKDWITLKEVRTPLPPSDFVLTPQCKANTWYMDENFFVNEFSPVTTARLRVVVRRTTHGFMTDERAVKAAGWSANAPHLMLREIEIYGPVPRVEVKLELRTRSKTEAFTSEPVQIVVSNSGPMRFLGKARLEVPKGWKTTPAEVAVDIGGKDSKTVEFQLLPPPGVIPVGPVPLTVALVDQQGSVLNFDRVTLQLASAVKMTPRLPGKIDPQRQEIPIQIKNISEKPVHGRVEVSAIPAGAPQGISDSVAFGPLNPNQDMTVMVPLKGMDLFKSGWHLHYAVSANGLVQSATQDWSPVRRWNVLGPFPNLTGRAFDTDFGPEKGVDLKQTFSLEEGKTIHWKPALSSPSGYLDLASLFKPNILVCAYAVVYVKSPTARQALLSAGSDDGGKMWINGKLVVSTPGARSAATGQDKAQVELREGWNEVLVKIHQSHGGWGFYFDLLTPQGGPMSDLLYAPTKEH